MQKHKTTITVMASIVGLAIAGLVMAQPGGQGGNRGGTPEERQARMDARMQEQLEVTAAEWSALKPFFQKVQDLSRQASGRGGMFGGRGGRGGRPGGPEANAEPQNDVEKYGMALDKLLDTEKPSNEDLKAALTSLRGARAKSELELTQAQNELRGLLTLKQEARLVRMGLLK